MNLVTPISEAAPSLHSAVAAALPVVSINGRFRSQTVTGVQRYAIEIIAALDRIWPADRPPPALLVPPAADWRSDFRSIVTRPVGQLSGQLWEQVDLPLATTGLLVSLGNLGPVARRDQVVLLHDTGVFAVPDSYTRRFRLLYKATQRLLARRGVRFVAQSEFTRGEISRYLGVPSDSIGVLGAGADHILRQPADPAILARHQLQPGRFVLAVGSLAPHKNLAALGRTADRLRQIGVSLVITGGINSRVFGGAAALPEPACYVGRVSDAELRALYEGAACFVFPSRYEGLGFPALEAMQCGCPVVASSAGALPEVCGGAAILVDPGSPEAIAEAVCGVVASAELRERLRGQGRLRADGFTWERAARALLATIDAIAPRTPGPTGPRARGFG